MTSNFHAKMSIRSRVESGSHLIVDPLNNGDVTYVATYDPCTCDLHSKVVNAKCSYMQMAWKKF